MNKKRSIDFILIIFILGLLLIFGGCSKSPERRKTWTTTSDSLPKKPTQGQIFRDRDNNSWAYNAALGAWVLGSGGYRYYPETNSYTDGSGKTVIPPRSISSGISEGVKARVSPKKKVVLTKEPQIKETSKRSILGRNLELIGYIECAEDNNKKVLKDSKIFLGI